MIGTSLVYKRESGDFNLVAFCSLLQAVILYILSWEQALLNTTGLTSQ